MFNFDIWRYTVKPTGFQLLLSNMDFPWVSSLSVWAPGAMIESLQICRLWFDEIKENGTLKYKE
ncbi:hypothetical protein swp_5019 [Shewanella piezotolerans WP3]|uniref:Uncharacterized protein n=1 Tax=Shewanella piezotolerans (strain WP3 / JCM 13877) TaxID=225849 RepID=B8CVF7_SHEPW|nr:hypothetical protein swp_5019 [Shewanella piezotolerans WP3]